MKRLGLTLAVLFCLTTSGKAQEAKIQAYSDNISTHGEARLLFWDDAAYRSVAELAILYGRPEWKADYEKPGSLDQMTKGKFWRVGQNFWTLLDTNAPLKIGGQEVGVGMYYLAVHRSEDGATWSLVFLNPSETRSKRLDAFETATRTGELSILFKAPLTFSTQIEVTPHLDIALTSNPNDFNKATLDIKWGKFALTTPVEVMVK